jgi:hypothetical protein
MVSESKSYQPLLNAGDWLKGLLPDDVEKQLTDFLEKRNQNPDAPGPDEAAPTDDATDTPAAPDDASSSAPAA